MQDLGRTSGAKRHTRSPGALLAAVCLAVATPAAAAPAPLPDWDAAKKKPAPLPDWDVSKPAKKPGKKPKPKPTASPDAPAESTSPEVAPGEPTGEAPTEAAPTEAPPAETATPAPADGAPVEPASEPAEVEGPVEPPAAPTAADRAAAERAGRVARMEIAAGTVLLVGGLASFGVMSGGVFIKGSAERELDNSEGYTDEQLKPLYSQQKQGETMLAAGAVVGVIGMTLGIALLGAGLYDRKGPRASSLARVRVAPSFGGLVVSGRF